MLTLKWCFSANFSINIKTDKGTRRFMKCNRERGNVRLRFLDRYFGIPIIIILGLLKRKNGYFCLDNINEVAFLHTAAIGDTVLLSAIVKDLKEAYPDTNLTVFVGPCNYEMAKLISGVERIIKLPVNNPIESVKSIMKSGVFDIWIDFGPWPRLNSLLTHFSRAKLKIGFKTKGQVRHYVYDRSIEHSDSVHELRNYRKLLESLGINCRNLPSLQLDFSKKFDNRITIHMFPGGYKSYLKEWPAQNWIEIINFLIDGNYDIYLTGAKANEGEAIEIKNKVSNTESVTVVAGKLGLEQTAELLKSSELVISVNTGIMHLAAALRCNLVAIHGPTSVQRWGPLNVNAISVKSDLDCSPCLNLGFEYKCSNNQCMKNISVATVKDSVSEMLQISK
jgi:ADP-heptose:LPS heptosyltransferase